MKIVQRKTMLVMIGIIVGTLLVTSCGVSKDTVAAKDREIANLRAQVADVQQDAKYWRQLNSVFMPVAQKLPSMSDHTAFMTPEGFIMALHFDNTDLSKAQDLNWVALGVPGKFTKQDQERVEKQFGKGFTHFHDLMADTHGGPTGVEGVWFLHIAVREFSAPWGALKPGVDHNFMPTPAP